MLVHRNTYEGMPPRLYRTPTEIKRDIAAISAKVKDVENMLSFRELVLEVAGEGKPPEVWIPELYAAVDEAGEALDTLHILQKRLNSLGDELGEVKCLLRM